MEGIEPLNIIILATYFVYFIIEVNHDHILGLIRNFLRALITNNPRLLTKEDEVELNEDWHSWDWKGHALLATLVGFLPFYFTRDFYWFTLPIAIACVRVLTLNIGLNIKSGNKNKFHLGKGKIDQTLYKYFKNYWPIPIIIILLSQIILRVYL